MITLYSYPELFGLADNNPYGLKIFAFLKLCKLEFRHEHIFDAKSAPRGQLPYIIDDGETIGDSDAIVSHLIRTYRLSIDAALIGSRQTNVTRHEVPALFDGPVSWEHGWGFNVGALIGHDFFRPYAWRSRLRS
jgi:Glutathione S-transferase N-terminal domain